MKLNEFSKETQEQINRLAKKRGITAEEVVARFDNLFRGRGVSKHSRKIFS